jgi:hypothetical protein
MRRYTHSDDEDDREQEARVAAAMRHQKGDIERNEGTDAFMSNSDAHLGRRCGLFGTRTVDLRQLLSWRNLLMFKLAVIVLMVIIGGHMVTLGLRHSHMDASTIQVNQQDQQQLPPQPHPLSDGHEHGIWSRSNKFLQDGLQHLRHSWERRTAQGKVSVIIDTTARCARPNELPESSSQFYLGGQYFDRLPPPSYPVPNQRGVVISASGTVPRLATGAYITAYLIRKVLRSTLPIEIYYVGEREIFDPTLKRHLRDLGDVQVLDLMAVLRKKFARLVDEAGTNTAQTAAAAKMAKETGKDTFVESSIDPKDVRGALSNANGHLSYLLPSIEQLASYAAKPYAVLASYFQEVILFDAGAVPFFDPEYFLTLPDYRASGFMAFRDYVPSSPNKWDWIPEEFCVDTELVTNYYQDTEGDSSCVLFDKAQNWNALLVTAILNGPLQHITYHKLNGDKDTWAMAMVYSRSEPLPPLHTVPGFLFVDYEGNYEARKVHGQLQLLKVDLEEDDGAIMGAKDDRQVPPGAAGLLVPLYYNNQLCKSEIY